MKNGSSLSGLLTSICDLSFVIFFLCALCSREKKCIAGFQPAKVVLTKRSCRGSDAGETPALRFFLTTRVSVVKQDMLPLQGHCLNRREETNELDNRI